MPVHPPIANPGDGVITCATCDQNGNCTRWHGQMPIGCAVVARDWHQDPRNPDRYRSGLTYGIRDFRFDRLVSEATDNDKREIIRNERATPIEMDSPVSAEAIIAI